MEPHIQYVKTSDDVSIAYWVMGDGPPLVYLPGLPRHAQRDWQFADLRRHYEWLAARHRLVRFDARNTGLSQRAVENVSIEARQLDLEAVADRLRLDQFVLYGSGPAGGVAVAFAAGHPERVRRRRVGVVPGCRFVACDTGTGRPHRLRLGDLHRNPRRSLLGLVSRR